MPPNIVEKVHGWVTAIQDERKRVRDEATPSKSGETVSLDYSAWFEGEDI